MGGKCCPFGAPGLSLQPPPGKKKGKEERREGGGRGEKTEGGGGREKKRERERHFHQRIYTLAEQLFIQSRFLLCNPGLLNPISIYAIKVSRYRAYTISPPHITGHGNSFGLNAKYLLDGSYVFLPPNMMHLSGDSPSSLQHACTTISFVCPGISRGGERAAVWERSPGGHGL